MQGPAPSSSNAFEGGVEKMNCIEVRSRLSDYIDNDLPADERKEVEQHLEECPGCRVELNSLRLLQSEVASLPKEISPARDLWSGIEDRVMDRPSVVRRWALSLRHRRNGTHGIDRPSVSPTYKFRPSRRVISARWLVPVAAGLLVAVVGFWFITFRLQTGWNVSRLEGSPKVGSSLVRETGKLRVGDLLETDASSRAKIDVGLIGQVEVQPNSRLRLLQAKPTDHRLALDRGTIHASIWAPPRLFFVETPSAVAVDLGCEYTLHVDSTGAAILQVTAGWVSLEDRGRESIIPAGAMCVTRPGLGPGTPFLADASETFRAGLMKFNFEDGGSEALETVLAEARNMDSITLWHLFFRTEAVDRARIYDRLASLVPPPAGVTRDGMLAGNADMIKAWQEHLNLGVKPW